MSLFGYVFYSIPVCITCHITLPHVTWPPPPPPPRPPSHVSVSPPDSSLAKHPDPPLRLCLWTTAIPFLHRPPVSAWCQGCDSSEPSLASLVQWAPANACLSTPDSSRTGAPAPEISLHPTVPMLVLGNWCGGGGGGPGRRRRPPQWSWTQKFCTSCFFSLQPIPQPPSPIPRTTARVPKTSLRMGGFLCVAPMPSTAISLRTVTASLPPCILTSVMPWHFIPTPPYLPTPLCIGLHLGLSQYP